MQGTLGALGYHHPESYSFNQLNSLRPARASCVLKAVLSQETPMASEDKPGNTEANPIGTHPGVR